MLELMVGCVIIQQPSLNHRWSVSASFFFIQSFKKPMLNNSHLLQTCYSWERARERSEFIRAVTYSACILFQLPPPVNKYARYEKLSNHQVNIFLGSSVQHRSEHTYGQNLTVTGTRRSVARSPGMEFTLKPNSKEVIITAAVYLR